MKTLMQSFHFQISSARAQFYITDLLNMTSEASHMTAAEVSDVTAVLENIQQAAIEDEQVIFKKRRLLQTRPW